MPIMSRQFVISPLVLAASLGLTACGGGGSSSRPSPTPTPTPTPRSTPTQAELDAETARSNGVTSSKATAAYAQGATGEGQLVAIMDTGALHFLTDLSDNSGTGPDAPDKVFEDRLHPASGPLWGTDTPGDFTQHGTLVAATIGAAKDGRGMHGVAPDATLLYYDYGDYCLASTCTEDQWQESFERYRVGMQDAIDRGAVVMNFSLGEDRFPDRMIPTTANAVAADMVIVISAGNEGQANPHAMAIGFANLAPEHTIIAGAINANGSPASFTNLAGSAMDNYLMALGVNVATYNNSGQLVTASGTSLSAPIITGAVALLAQAFPNLTGAEIVDILFVSADDAGAPGTDPIYGRGILNIQSAFAPIGTTSLAGSSREVWRLYGGISSPAMGDATGALDGAVFTDRYRRAYTGAVGGFAMQAGSMMPLRALAQEGLESHGLALGDNQLALTMAEPLDRDPALPDGAAAQQFHSAQIDLGVGEGSRLALGVGRDIEALEAGWKPAGGQFLTGSLAGWSGFYGDHQLSAATRFDWGGMRFSLAAEQGEVATFRPSWQFDAPDRYRKLKLGAARAIGPLSLGLSLTRLDEEGSILGGSTAFADAGATSHFVDSEAALALGPGWSLSGRYRHGWSRMDGIDALLTGGRLQSSAWSMELVARRLAGGQFAFRASQPLRVDQGGWDAYFPTSFDYQTMLADSEARLVSLSPSGREIDFEASYARRLFGTGRLSANLYLRRQPGHVANAGADKGIALSFSAPLR